MTCAAIRARTYDRIYSSVRKKLSLPLYFNPWDARVFFFLAHTRTYVGKLGNFLNGHTRNESSCLSRLYSTVRSQCRKEIHYPRLSQTWIMYFLRWNNPFEFFFPPLLISESESESRVKSQESFACMYRICELVIPCKVCGPSTRGIHDDA